MAEGERVSLRFESLLRRPELGVMLAVLVLAVLGWVQLASLTPGPAAAAHASHGALHGGGRDYPLMLLMWLSMSVAMMLPAAAPAILAFAALAYRGEEQARSPIVLASFVGGYLVVWIGFGLLAAAVQWLLAAPALRLSALHAEASSSFSAGLLVAAGAYQYSALKHRCLEQCRSPLAFFLAHWRAGAGGALGLGLRHGLHCLGCCWALMALMLIGGAMSLAWTAALAALLLVEKVAPAGPWFGRAVGLGLIGWGGALLAAARVFGT